jgi:hypothetical protein
MTLEDLIDDYEGASDNEYEDEQDDQYDNPVNEDGTIDLDQVYSHDPDNGIDITAEKKCCPQCMTVTYKERKRIYECDNDDCGVIQFTCGWFEQAHWQEFFPSIVWPELLEDWR